MIGLVVVAHFNLAREMVAATELIVGKQKQFGFVDIFPTDDVDKVKDKVVQALKKADSGEGIIILTDMFGGTPSNLAISIMDNAKVEVIAGVNLPMLIKLASIRQSEGLAKAVSAAQEAGRKYINVASALLAEEKDKR